VRNVDDDQLIVKQRQHDNDGGPSRCKEEWPGVLECAVEGCPWSLRAFVCAWIAEVKVDGREMLMAVGQQSPREPDVRHAAKCRRICLKVSRVSNETEKYHQPNFLSKIYCGGNENSHNASQSGVADEVRLDIAIGRCSATMATTDGFPVLAPKPKAPSEDASSLERDGKHSKFVVRKKRIAIDGAFFKKLRGLLKIVMPSWRSKPAVLLAMHTTFLLARTFVSIVVARLDGALVKAIVDRNGRQFAIEMAKWLLLAWPACYINSMIKFLEGKVALALRTNLTAHALRKYTEDDCHYRVSNLDGRLANADQCLTQDITAFTSSLAHLWSHLSKPAFDVALISFELLRHNRSRGHNGTI